VCRRVSMWNCLNSFWRRFKSPIAKFLDWVLAFFTYSQALASGSSSPTLACDLLTFVGTVARLARDHPGSAWASYEHAARAKAVANPHFQWKKLDQELWALATVRGSAGPSSYPHQGGGRSGKRARNDINACFKWNDGTCNFKICKYSHVCSSCFTPHHKVGSCPSAPKAKKTT
jgi:hypothetical protein